MQLEKSSYARTKKGLDLQLPVNQFRNLSIPGVYGAPKLGVCFVRVVDIPGILDDFMEVNPRVPSRSKKGLLAGPVTKGILTTLRESPEEMVIKNQGIYLLVDEANFARGANESQGTLHLKLSDVGKHGIVNGGHTYAAIREAIETSEGEELKTLQKAYVRFHIFQNIAADYVPEMAEGLNRSKQVDDPSLVNLQGEFDIIRKVLKGTKGEKAIAYHQGDDGEVYISDILVYLSMFNLERFSEKKHPNGLYNRSSLGLKYFSEDIVESRSNMLAIIEKLPDILWLADSIRKKTPLAAKANNFKFGMVKLGNERLGGAHSKGTNLPFLAEKMDYRVPNGWVYPMLAAFRANLVKSSNGKHLEWKIPLPQILADTIDDLVGVCVSEHKDNNARPELIGKRESAYSQCFTKVQLYLAKRNLLY
jgi:hypothetical protein